jgi:regulatory protein
MEDGKRLSLYRQTVEDFGLYAGMELTVEQFLQIEEANGAVSAKMRAVRIVAASSVSKKDLQQRLIQKGEDPDHAADAVAWMEEMHLVDDEETARQIVSRCAARGYGLSRAKQALYEKKVPKRYWNAALADFPDQTEHIIAFLRTKIRNYADDRETKKAIDALLRRGHSYAEIRSALQQMMLDPDEFPEE